MDKLSVQDLDLNGKKVLIRVDFNVPLDKSGQISDDTRIIASLPTIKYVLEHGAAVILMSHLGRPKGRSVVEFSLAPCAKRLGVLLGRPVKFGKSPQDIKPGEVLLLENLRYNAAEEDPEKDPEFAKKLASMADIYINDAFGTAHRAHTSTVEVPKLMDIAACGLLLEKEIRFLGDTLKYPKRPFYTIIGGAKVSSKIGVLKALRSKVDGLLIGGAMAFTFLKAQGIEIGNSLFEPDYVVDARKILEGYLSAGKVLLLPQDLVLNNERIVTVEQGVPIGFKGMDIGPATIQRFQNELQKAKTVLWNGPMGVFEQKEFAKGTYAIANTLATLDATTIVGGGDSVAAVNQAHLSHKFTHLSTGGGASLEYLEFGTLPALEVLTNS